MINPNERMDPFFQLKLIHWSSTQLSLAIGKHATDLFLIIYSENSDLCFHLLLSPQELHSEKVHFICYPTPGFHDICREQRLQVHGPFSYLTWGSQIYAEAFIISQMHIVMSMWLDCFKGVPSHVDLLSAWKLLYSHGLSFFIWKKNLTYMEWY